MKKPYLFLFILLGYSLISNSQVINNRYIIDQSAVVFQRLVQTKDTIITMGLGSTFYPPYPSKLMFTKFDHEGEVLGYDLIIGDSLIHYYPLSSSSQGRKVVAVGGAGENLTNESGFYALYDLDTGLEWIKQYHPPNDGWILFFENCLFLNDKILILANQQDLNNGYIISTKLICIDLQGEILWEKNFENSNPIFDLRAKGITLNQNSNVYIGLDIYPNLRSVIYELDLDGNIISEWINDEINTLRPEQIIDLGNSSLLFTGRYFTGEYSSNNFPIYQGYICKVDSLTHNAWSLKTGKPTFPTDMNNLTATMDGNYIAIGVTGDSLSASQSLTISGHIVKFNIEGEIIWERRHFGIDTDSEDNKLFDIVELPDSSLLLCGVSIDWTGDYPEQGWLLKLDKDGNIENSVSIVSPYFSPSDNQLIVFPNPANEQIELRFKDQINIHQIEVYDTSGRLVSSKRYDTIPNGKVTMNISYLESGIYIVKVNGKYIKKVYVY